jgi:uncharacterized protein YuzE
MRIAYDPSVDALSIIFTETTVTTEHVAEGIAIDYDANGLVAGIEILGRARKIRRRQHSRPCNIPGRGNDDGPRRVSFWPRYV